VTGHRFWSNEDRETNHKGTKDTKKKH
jgi:hypothetical protein